VNYFTVVSPGDIVALYLLDPKQEWVVCGSWKGRVVEVRGKDIRVEAVVDFVGNPVPPDGAVPPWWTETESHSWKYCVVTPAGFIEHEPVEPISSFMKGQI
jgi:hypothetical protein